MDRKVKAHFKKVDPKLFAAFLKVGELELTTTRVPKEYFAALCREIIAQQLSGKVAQVIFERFQNLFPKKQITPKFLLKLDDKVLRATGMSNSKVKFLKDLAGKVESKEISLKELEDLDSESVIEKLIQVKGIGRWTAEMFLIFCLGREDVFSFGDLGLNKAVRKIYGLEKATKEEMEKIVSKWSPYRSYAAIILWRSLD